MRPQAAAMTENPSPSVVTNAPGADSFHLRDGRCVILRPVVIEDAPRLAKLSGRLSAESSHLRFFRAGRHLTPEEALGLADIDHDRNEAFVALDGDCVVALGSFNQLGADPHAELTLLVDDAYNGVGLGRHILKLLIDSARARQYSMLLTELLPENERMSGILESAGVRTISDTNFGLLRVYLFLD
jgi:GNAT superfamily N-acetyltransferase